MGIYDRDWWRDRYNKRIGFDEQKDASWRKPKDPPAKLDTAPNAPAPQNMRQRAPGLRPSPVGAIIVWLAIFLAIFISVKSLFR